MRRFLIAGILGCGLTVYDASTLRAEVVAPGVTYTLYTLPGPVKAYVVATDRVCAEYKLKLGWPQKKRNFTSRQTVSTIAGLYDSPPSHDVLAAVNASFFADSGIGITGTAASDGEMLEAPHGAWETFLFGPTRMPLIRENISHVNGVITFASGATTTLHGYNKPRAVDTAILYTPQWGPSTTTTFQGVEVILSDLSLPMRGDKEISGVITAVRTGSASLDNAVPEGGAVLSARGVPVAAITAAAQVGQRLRLRVNTSAPDYNNADMAVTGAGYLVRNGAPNTADWAGWADSFARARHPRTALAWNNAYLYLVAVDGRSTASIGMTFAELAAFLINTLNADEALNLDGGGSTTLVVDGAVRNVPSDGSQRPVANAVLLVRQDTATAFPFSDSFTSIGRLPGWRDKFTYNAVAPFTPAAPGGDGYVLEVADRTGGVETVVRGDFSDADYTVEAAIFCEYRPEVAGNGFERYGLIARDSGTGAFGLANYGGGNCYALTYDSDTGRIRAGRYVDGALTDFLAASPVLAPFSAWRNLKIACAGPLIRYYVDGVQLAAVNDTTFANGGFGVGYHEFFASNANIHGTRVDRFQATSSSPPTRIPADFDADGDVDLADFGHLQACLTGPSVPQTAVECADARLDADADVDQDDFELFAACISGPHKPVDPGCLQPAQLRALPQDHP